MRLPSVVPRKGDVDRNASRWPVRPGLAVVPRKGDVDRNALVVRGEHCHPVVPRKGDVDRNDATDAGHVDLARSSPARGTWIEIRIRGSDYRIAEGRPPQGGRG